MQFLSKSIPETRTVAGRVLSWLKGSRDMTGAMVIGLGGDLGAGKTAFVKEFVSLLGITENVSSPTFILMQKFPILEKTIPFKTIIHIDAYRIENENELAPLGWQEIVSNPENLVLIEWPERVPNAIPANAPRIDFKHHEEGVHGIFLPDEMIL